MDVKYKRTLQVWGGKNKLPTLRGDLLLKYDTNIKWLNSPKEMNVD